MLLQPTEILIKTLDGDERTYVISKFPAVAGREILTQYPVTAMPRIGAYKENEALMLKMMAYVAVPTDDPDRPIVLKTRALVDNHVPDWETLARIELALINYNCSFFRDGRTSAFFAGLGTKAASRITEILTGLLANLSVAAKQPSRN
jgi:hypothetical protein